MDNHSAFFGGPRGPRTLRLHSPRRGIVFAAACVCLVLASAALGADRYLNINFGNGADGHSPVGVETILGSKPMGRSCLPTLGL